MILDEMRGNTVLENLGEGIIIIDRDFKVVYFNRRAEMITQFARQEALGKRCREILRLPNCEDACPVQRFIHENESIIDYESLLANKKGKKLPVHIRFSLLRDPTEGFSGGIIAIRDMPSKRIVQADEGEEEAYSFQGIISSNRQILRLFEILPDISASDASVLIQGESGTGKELFASAVHNLSPRQRGPFIKVNCAALPDTLLESELFGYLRGAFTDARRDKPGMFQLADGGTLFLDEIGDITPALQVKLLHVAQDGEFTPLGGTQPQRVDARLISATNRNLEEMVKGEHFRMDLYYRLNVVKIQIPPLRERPEDIPLLTRHLIKKFQSNSESKVHSIAPDALRALQHYEFPGNVRELENIIEHASILCKEKSIQRHHLPSYIFGLEKEFEQIQGQDQRMEEVEARTILRVLKKHHGNKVLAARELGMHRTTLWRKLKRIGT